MIDTKKIYEYIDSIPHKPEPHFLTSQAKCF